MRLAAKAGAISRRCRRCSSRSLVRSPSPNEAPLASCRPRLLRKSSGCSTRIACRPARPRWATCTGHVRQVEDPQVAALPPHRVEEPQPVVPHALQAAEGPRLAHPAGTSAEARPGRALSFTASSRSASSRQ